MREDLNALSRATNEHNGVLSVLQATDEALMRVGEMLDEMRRLAELGCVESASTEETAARLARYEELKSEIDRMVASQYYGAKLFCSGNIATEEAQISIQFGSGSDTEDASRIEVVDSTTKGLGISNSNIATPDKADEAHQVIMAASIKVDEARRYFGAVQAKLSQL